MKTNKQNGTQNRRICAIALIAIAIAMATALIGCKEDDEPPPPPDLPKDQSATIHPFEDLELTVKGTFKDSEWVGVAGKIETAINGIFVDLVDPTIQGIIKGQFAQCESIIVEQTSEYTKYKTTGDGKTVYLNYVILDNAEIKTDISAAFISMKNNEVNMAKIVVPQYNREAARSA